jgi:mannose-6-phosphate isomerase-like protein (cupin superfamily)
MSYADPVDALLLPPGHGEGLWHLDTLWTFKIPATASGGAFSLAEQLITKGSAPPVHRHTREDEAWIVLDGEVTFFIDDEQHTAGPGSYVFPALVKPSSAPPGDRPDPSPSHRRSSPT